MKKIVFTLIVAFTGMLIQAQKEHKLDNPITYYEYLVIKGEKSDKEFDTSTQYAYTKVQNEIVYYDRPEKSFKYNDEAMYKAGYEFVRTDQTSYSDQKIYKNYKKYVTITVSYFLDGSLMISFMWNNPEYHNPEFTLTGNAKEASDRLKKEEEERKRLEKVVEDMPQTTIEVMPEFPGGLDGMMIYLSENIKYPPLAKDSGIQGRVFISAIIEIDGSVSNVKMLRGIGGGCDEEAVRVVEIMPKWSPGLVDGKPVRVSYLIPIKFTLQ